jgi:hypothetical protein
VESHPRTALIAVEAVCAVLAAVVGLASSLSEPVDVARERQQRQAMRSFAQQCADALTGKRMASAEPGWAGICTTVGVADVALPVDRLVPVEQLAGAYLASVRTLLLSVRSPFHRISDEVLAAINAGGVYADGIRTAGSNTGGCASSAVGSVVAALPDDTRLLRLDAVSASVVRRDGDIVELDALILEGFATCVVTGRAPDRYVLGTVKATMVFRATGGGWKLHRMRACPSVVDPGLESFPRASRDESVFRFIADFCDAAA